MWQTIPPRVVTPELIADVYGVMGEEAERTPLYYGS